LSSVLATVLATVAALAVLVPTVRFSGRTGLKSRGSRDSCALPPIAAISRWWLLLLSSLLSAWLAGVNGTLMARLHLAGDGPCPVRAGSAWPLVSDRSVRRDSGVQHDFVCTFAGPLPPVLVALRSQSCWRPEGRTRTLSGPSPDLCFARTLAPSKTIFRSQPGRGLRRKRCRLPGAGLASVM
jgi:hypothetical protein